MVTPKKPPVTADKSPNEKAKYSTPSVKQPDATFLTQEKSERGSSAKLEESGKNRYTPMSEVKSDDEYSVDPDQQTISEKASTPQVEI